MTHSHSPYMLGTLDTLAKTYMTLGDKKHTGRYVRKGSAGVMAMEQTDQRLRVFISYSRIDSDFAYRLRADLEASGYSIWIDTAKLGAEGGQEWLRVIQDAVDFCQAMVVVVSPESVQSKYVHQEYHRAQSQNKLVIPVHYRTVTSAPIDLALDQWLEFRENQNGPDTYQAGLTNLIRSLAKVPQLPKLPPIPQAPRTQRAPLVIAEGMDMPVFKAVPPAPQAPPDDIRELIAGMYDSRGRGDLISEEYFLRKIVENTDARDNASYLEQLKGVTSRLEQQRASRLHQLADEAVASKQWRRALGAWQALLTTLPNDPEAIKGIRQARIERAGEALRDGEYDESVGVWQALLRTEPSSEEIRESLRQALRARADDAWDKADWIRAAESWETLRALRPPEPYASDYLAAIHQNQREAYRYQLAQRLLAADNTPAARAALVDVYRAAPHYGDPAGIAKQLDVPVDKRLEDTLKDQSASASRLSMPQGWAKKARASGQRRRLFKRYVISSAASVLIIIVGFVLTPRLGSFVQPPGTSASNTPTATVVPGLGLPVSSTPVATEVTCMAGRRWVPAGDSPSASCAAATLTLQQASSHDRGVPAIVYTTDTNPTSLRKASVTISQIAQGACAGMILVGDTAQAPNIAFSIFVCADGAWRIYKYDGTTENSPAPCAGTISPNYPVEWVFYCPTQIKSGATQVRTPVTLTVTENQTSHSLGFEIGSTSIAAIDISNAGVNAQQQQVLGLAVLSPRSAGLSASFQNFELT